MITKLKMSILFLLKKNFPKIVNILNGNWDGMPKVKLPEPDILN